MGMRTGLLLRQTGRTPVTSLTGDNIIVLGARSSHRVSEVGPGSCSSDRVPALLQTPRPRPLPRCPSRSHDADPQDEMTLTTLKSIGIDVAQGYHIGRPMPDLRRWIEERAGALTPNP